MEIPGKTGILKLMKSLTSFTQILVNVSKSGKNLEAPRQFFKLSRKFSKLLKHAENPGKYFSIPWIMRELSGNLLKFLQNVEIFREILEVLEKQSKIKMGMDKAKP